MTKKPRKSLEILTQNKFLSSKKNLILSQKGKRNFNHNRSKIKQKNKSFIKN